MVNPAEAKIAISKSSRRDHLAHKVLYSEEHIELYSASLVESLMDVNQGLEDNSCYRLYGDVDAQSGMACFSMLHPILLEE